ncbi:MAG: hypothetical protein G01um101420_873 [Parcubacteria group bacterium Gr01-1014_20]|nr:MAG: hypothetical protein G01um101420_873 [Parcubacteria group bacterium Gr01-1014_20]
MLGILVMPPFASAQGMMNFSDAQTPSNMMQYLGEKTLGPEIYAETQDLMAKMMTGKLTEEEASRMIEIMNQYPGPMGMMMGGYNQQDYRSQNWGMPHMGYWADSNYSPWSWVSGLMHLVWLLISILALVWLWQKVTKK